jgi:uncharacterized protein with PIN domain
VSVTGQRDEIRFIVDNNVGKLAVWLRALGYDSAFVNPIADSDREKSPMG